MISQSVEGGLLKHSQSNVATAQFSVESMGTDPYSNMRPPSNSQFRPPGTARLSLKRIPSSRDGHTGVIYKGWLIVFGGDRYCMPFNDTFVYNIQKEIKDAGAQSVE